MAKFTTTADKIKALKKKLSCNILDITVTAPSKDGSDEQPETFRALVKDPYDDMNVLSRALGMKDNPVKRNQFLLNNLWIDGDEEFKTDNKVIVSAGSAIANAIDIYDSEVKKH